MSVAVDRFRCPATWFPAQRGSEVHDGWAILQPESLALSTGHE
jgi:hypothetical protein